MRALPEDVDREPIWDREQEPADDDLAKAEVETQKPVDEQTYEQLMTAPLEGDEPLPG